MYTFILDVFVVILLLVREVRVSVEVRSVENEQVLVFPFFIHASSGAFTIQLTIQEVVVAL